MHQSKINKDINDFLSSRKWLENVEEIEFLAAGEYNENYLVRGDGSQFVFRINHGSQLGLENQIKYEYSVLKTLQNSGVTPKPFFCDATAESPGKGVLLMEYIPGTPLTYEKDYDKAAYIFASIHNQPYGDDLILQSQPVFDIAKESYGLIKRYEEHPLKGVQKRLLQYHEQVLKLGQATQDVFKNEKFCVVNTEVNSNNFIIYGDEGYLVDWEKAVLSYRYQDLGHFVVPTTTLWKSNYTFDRDSKIRFLKIYSDQLNYRESIDEIVMKTDILEKTILLRALSWCYMAYFEYTQQDRTLKDDTTFKRIQWYLKEIECFLS
jgi:thiamine kinase-like enzyme